MKRISVATIVIFLLVVPFASFKIEKASAGTVTVPDDYLTIQEAINNANDGDTVFVKAGTYFENIVVNKTVSLFGQGRETTFVDGQHLGNVMVVEADNVTIMGFTIRESRRMYPNCAGILLNHVRHANISENNLIDNLEGITLSYSSDSNIAGNNIKTKYMGWGLSILYSTNNSIIENNITENWAAFRLDHSYNNRILGNNVVGNYDYDALYLWDSSNNVLKDNAIDDLQVMGSEVSHFANEVDMSNTINGKPILYLVNQQNLTITPQTYPNIGYLAIVNSTNITIKHLDIKNTNQGILLAFTEDSLVENVTITDYKPSSSAALSQIRLVSSTNNTLFQNIIANSHYGIWLIDSSYNSLVKNRITGNTEGITVDTGSSENRIFENEIANNEDGILVESTNNSFFHNNFVQNQKHVLVCFGYEDNLWDNDYFSEGNYWSDYNGVDIDGDGIGDTPYIIDGWIINQDNYPLMSPYVTGDINHDAIVDICDVAKIAGIFGCSSADPQFNPHCDVNQDNVIGIFDLVVVAEDFGKEWTPP